MTDAEVLDKVRQAAAQLPATTDDSHAAQVMCARVALAMVEQVTWHLTMAGHCEAYIVRGDGTASEVAEHDTHIDAASRIMLALRAAVGE